MLIDRGGNPSEEAEKVSKLIDEAIDTSRSLTSELSPPMLHRGGLLPSLNWLTQWFSSRHGLTVKLNARDDMDPAPEEIVILLFQSIRELLFNIVKHAGVHTARVKLSQRNNRIFVSIEDKGAGFNPNQFRVEGGKTGGFGLFSISERLSFLGGKMEIESAPGRGSRFSLVIPYSAVVGKPSRDSVLPKASDTPTSKFQPVTDRDERKIRVLLADDHVMVRQGLASLLKAEPDMEIVGEASTGEFAVDLARKLQPDFVLMDINMPGMNGIEATRIIHRELPDIRIIGLSLFESDEQATAMREAGAVYYFSKSGPTDSVISAIRTNAGRSAKHAQRAAVKPKRARR